MDELSEFGRALAETTWHAGEIVLSHYEAETEARQKADQSPVTAADEEAEQFILARLRALAPGRFGLLSDDELVTRGLWQYALYYDPAAADLG